MTQVTSSPIPVPPGRSWFVRGLIVAAIAPWISKFLAGVHHLAVSVQNTKHSSTI
jgi:hypothetical protein